MTILHFSFAQLSFSTRILLTGITGLLVLGCGLFAISYNLFVTNAADEAVASQATSMRVAWTVLGEYGKSFRIADGKMYAGDTLLNDNTPVFSATNAPLLSAGVATSLYCVSTPPVTARSVPSFSSSDITDTLPETSAVPPANT